MSALLRAKIFNVSPVYVYTSTTIPRLFLAPSLVGR